MEFEEKVLEKFILENLSRGRIFFWEKIMLDYFFFMENDLGVEFGIVKFI